MLFYSNTFRDQDKLKRDIINFILAIYGIFLGGTPISGNFVAGVFGSLSLHSVKVTPQLFKIKSRTN